MGRFLTCGGILSLLYLMSSIVADKVITQTLTQWDPKVGLRCYRRSA